MQNIQAYIHSSFKNVHVTEHFLLPMMFRSVRKWTETFYSTNIKALNGQILRIS